MEKHKKCKMCCSDAKWELDGEYYCQFCLRTELNVWQDEAPRACEMCGAHLGSVYYTDDEDNPFCSPECALKYNGAERLEEDNDNESRD